MNSGERIPRRLCLGVSEQNTKKVLNGIGFLDSSAARSFNLKVKIIILILCNNKLTRKIEIKN